MDKLITNRQIITELILKYAQFRPSHGDIRLDPVLDEKRNHYALMQVGWDRGKRVRGNLIYITLKQEKVYIEYDGTEMGITEELINMGIPEQDIVLAFQAPEIKSSKQLIESQR
jgi:hypothetical protein